MATQIVDIDINILEKQLLGYYGISTTNWTGGTPSIASGSKWECAGALYEATSDTDCGTVGEFGAIGNDTLAYCYYSPVDLAFHWTATAPDFSTSKQGFYGSGGSATYRYVLSVYKDSLGAYTQLTLLLHRNAGVMYQGLNLGGQSANADRVMRFATDASITWDESEDKFISDKIVDVDTIIPRNGIRKTYADITSFEERNGNKTQNDFFDTLSPFVPNVDDCLFVWGAFSTNTVNYVPMYIRRTSSTIITLYGARTGGVTTDSFAATNGSATVFIEAVTGNCSIFW